jgi:hypothetical protein
MHWAEYFSLSLIGSSYRTRGFEASPNTTPGCLVGTDEYGGPPHRYHVNLTSRTERALNDA